MPNVYIDLERTGNRVLIRAKYDEDFVDELKAKIPSDCREWGPAQKVWAINRIMWPTARAVCIAHFGHDCLKPSPAAEVLETELLEEVIEDPDLEAYFTLGVRSDAPDAVVFAAMLIVEWANTNGGSEGRMHLALSYCDPQPRRGVPDANSPLEGERDSDLPPYAVAKEAFQRVLNHRGISDEDLARWYRYCGSSLALFVAARTHVVIEG